ncbi:hypothetical protein ILUMI_24187 [Ignelater luminosus]|uniref:Uncharacterized protein n=1 Tax=Ignelater luminosus TaxID=2038154 RepID=A0A8K0G178_IGNLU|nr:hypothetical protein ILUMI_24187 [Ignelater luminosus]
MRIQNQELANRICHYFEHCANRKKNNVVAHFIKEGIARTTIYNVLLRYKKNWLLLKVEKIFIVDDETYCAINPNDVPGRKYYHCTSSEDVLPEKKFKPKKKFFKKFLIWQAMDEYSNVSKPYIFTGTMNWQTYLKERLSKRLIPFIKNRDVIFLPDMTTSHYAVQCREFLKQNNVDFVTKVNNAPNTPPVRPIEKYWALLKREYAKRKTPAKNSNSFRRIMQTAAQKVLENNGPALISHLRKKLRQVGRKACINLISIKN